jgi:hypothetical protein
MDFLKRNVYWIAAGIAFSAAIFLGTRGSGSSDKSRKYGRGQGPDNEEELIEIADLIDADLNKSWVAWLGDIGHEAEPYLKAMKLNDQDFGWMVSYHTKYIADGKRKKTILYLMEDQTFSDSFANKMIARIKRLS